MHNNATLYLASVHAFEFQAAQDQRPYNMPTNHKLGSFIVSYAINCIWLSRSLKNERAALSKKPRPKGHRQHHQ